MSDTQQTIPAEELETMRKAATIWQRDNEAELSQRSVNACVEGQKIQFLRYLEREKAQREKEIKAAILFVLKDRECWHPLGRGLYGDCDFLYEQFIQSQTKQP